MKNHHRLLFPGQKTDEHVYLLTRRHWIVLAKEILVWLIFVVMLLIFDNTILPSFPAFSEPPFPPIINLLKSLYTMFLIMGLLIIWVIYYLNYQVVTNERIVDIDQKNLLYHNTSELHLQSLQDVTVEVKGILPTFFNFGTVYIQTAGASRNFEFDNIPNPHAVAKLILELHQKFQPGQKSL